jgi:hypothetical protein
MIYINNELIDYKKPEFSWYKTKFEDFKKKYADNLDTNQRRIIKPITIVYRPDKMRPDPNPRNKGRIIAPASIGLNFIARVSDKMGQMVEVRYSRSAGIPDPATKSLRFTDSFMDIPRSYPVADIDLAFFFECFSEQNHENPDNIGKKDTPFIFDNPEATRNAKAKAKAKEAAYQARLWGEASEGGLGEKRLRIIGSEMMIVDSATIELNELRERIESIVNLNPKLKDEFLDRTDTPNLTTDEEMERMQIVATAIENKIFSQNHITRSFHRHDPETKKQIKKPIFVYEKAEKQPRLRFYEYLEAQEPETIDALKSSNALLSEA